MGLITPGGENLLDFLELRQVLSTYDWDLRDPLCGLRKGQSPCELLMGLSGFLSLRCRGLRSCVEPVPEPEDSSPVLAWIWGYFWSLPSGVSPRLEWGHAHVVSSRSVAAVSRFPSRGSRDQGLSGRKVMTNLDSILKRRDITLPTKVCLVKAMVFPVVMYGCESWTVKKA